MPESAPFDSLAAYLLAKSKPHYERHLLFFWRRVAPYYQCDLRPGATEAALRDFECRFCVDLPRDVRENYLRMDGMDDYTDVDAGWIRLWPIANWAPVPSEDPSIDSEFSRFYAFADHSIWAWCYGIDLGQSTNEIYCFMDSRPFLVARSFTEFIRLVLADSEALFTATPNAPT